MLELRTFGGLSIKDHGAPITGAATQRKTLALLSLLAAAGKNGLSRDKLVAYLWPESDAEHGRSLLKQACYALRRDLHERSEERREGKSVDLGGRRIIKKKKRRKEQHV